MEDGLGIISRDAGKYVPTCAGEVPRRIMEEIEGSGAQGSTLFAQFSKPPYGYPADVVNRLLNLKSPGDFLRKPFAVRTLLEAVRHRLDEPLAP